MARRPGRPRSVERDTFLAEDIRILRSRRLTSVEIAAELGISRATYYRVLGDLKRK